MWHTKGRADVTRTVDTQAVGLARLCCVRASAILLGMLSSRCLMLSSAAACALSMGLATPAHAQSDGDRATARALGGDGQQALDSKDYKSAEDRFRRAESLVHAPSLMLGLARSLAGLGRYVEAQETYNRIIREGVAPTAPEAFKRALADAKKEVDGVGPKIGGVTISVHAAGGAEVANAKVVVDGAPVSSASLGVRRAIDPGPHLLQVSGDGFKPAEVHFDVVPGGSVDEPVTLEVDAAAMTASTGAATPPPVSPLTLEQPATARGGGARAVLPWVAFGVGAAGIGVGAVAGFIAMGKHSDIADKCNQSTTCAYAGAGTDIDSYHTVATISTVGFIVGGVGVAAGAILLLTRPKTESSAAPAHFAQTALRVQPVIGLGSIGAIGEF